MAAVTTGLSFLIIGGSLCVVAGARRRYLVFALASLGLSPAVNLFVKGPLARAIGTWLGVPPGLKLDTPWWFLLLLHFVSPVTEEAMKLAPAALCCSRRRWHDKVGALAAGAALGFGFGLGEIWYLAWRVAEAPGMAGYPWHRFTGFAWERVAAGFLHIVSTGIGALGLAGGFTGALAAYAAAVFVHAVGNVSAMMYQLGLWGASAHVAYLAGVVVVLILVFEYLRGKALSSRPRGEGEIVIYRRDAQTSSSIPRRTNHRAATISSAPQERRKNR